MTGQLQNIIAFSLSGCVVYLFTSLLYKLTGVVVNLVRRLSNDIPEKKIKAGAIMAGVTSYINPSMLVLMLLLHHDSYER